MSDDANSTTVRENDKMLINRIEQIEKRNDNRLALALQMTAAEFCQAEKSLKRKLDVRLMATIVFIYILNYLDRNNIAAVKVAGIEQDLHLTSTQYSTDIALLFVGYILMQVPSNMFLAHPRPSLYLPACMAAWGIIIPGDQTSTH